MDQHDSAMGKILASENESCSACGAKLRPGALFCEDCGPPERPPEHVPEALSLGQTTWRIVAIVVIFLTLAFFKSQPDLGEGVDQLISSIKSRPQQTTTEPTPQDKDFQIIHTINVPFANVRSKATTQSPVVTILEHGRQVKVLYKGDRWTQIELNGKNGWVASHLLDSRVE